MNTGYTLDLCEEQLEVFNFHLPKNHSFQKSEKAQRRRKAEKKLDDMFVAEFSLRPIKQQKKQHQLNDKKQKQTLQVPKNHIKQSFIKKEQQTKKEVQYSSISNKSVHSQKQQKYNPKVEIQKNNQPQNISAVGTVRSQRISKPTSNYLQFQEQTFKKKIPRQIQKVVPQSIQAKQFQKLIPLQKQQKNQQTIQKQTKKSYQRINITMSDSKIETTINDSKISAKIIDQKLKVKQSNQIIDTKQPNQNIYITKSDQIIVAQLKKIQKDEIVKIKKAQEIKSINIIKYQVQQQQMKQSKRQNSIKNEQKNIYQYGNSNPKSKFRSIIQKQRSFEQKQQANQVKQSYCSLSRCHKILQKLVLFRSSWPFRRPVDPIAQGVPNYLQIVKNPMDLKTIHKKLTTDKYTTQNDFFNDVQLMLSNSQLFNPKQTKYFQMTQLVRNYFNEIKYSTLDKKDKIIKKQSLKHPNQQFFVQEKLSSIESQSIEGEQKSKKRRNQSNKKQTNDSQIRTPVKIISTNDGPLRKASHQKKQKSSQKLQNSHAQIINQKQLINKQITIQKYIQQQVVISKQNRQKRQVRFGYPTPKPTIIQRQIFLYDLFRLSNSSQLKIKQFIQQNWQQFSQYKLKNNQPINQFQDYQIQLKDMDLETYRFLRKYVDQKIREDQSIQLQNQSINMQKI